MKVELPAPGTERNCDHWDFGCIHQEFVTLQHAATRCNTLHQDFGCIHQEFVTLQHTATRCNTLHQDFGCIHQEFVTLQHAATRCNTLQHAATHFIRTPLLMYTSLMNNELQLSEFLRCSWEILNPTTLLDLNSRILEVRLVEWCRAWIWNDLFTCVTRLIHPLDTNSGILGVRLVGYM